MNAHTERLSIAGPVGAIEVAIDAPHGAPRGLALVAHPHPLYGGALDNKVTQTLARAFVQLGYLAARPNFRGVGATEGAHDEGNGETDDLLTVIDALRSREPALASLPVALAGFSFGSFVVSRVARRMEARGEPAQRMVLVGAAAGRFSVEPVPPDTIVIHGEVDDTVPLAAVLDWARPQELPVVVIPGADHFFHRKLALVKRIVTDAWASTPGWAAPGAPL
jgi:alpha/beta superfamily hydrolase